jgi:parvulin-like peptidyl-prolyl isomerase
MKQLSILHTLKKMVLILFATISFSYSADMVNAVALIVNDEPITVYDIQLKKYQNKISREEAVNQLIDEVLYKELVAKYNITADIFDVNNYIEKVAASNGMDLYTFKSILRQKYKNYTKYEEEVKNTIINQKLTQKLIKGNIPIANEDDLKIYYENNQNMFSAASKVKAVQYISEDKKALEAAIKTPISNIDGVTKAPVDLDQSNINPQLKYIINETKINQFTPVFTANKKYISLLITQKEDIQTLAFDEVKDRIFNVIMQDREKKYLKDYFDKLKLSANIKIVR